MLAENAHGSELWDLPGWRRVLARSDLVRCTIDQCMVGLRDLETKLRVKKATDCVASDEILVKNLRGLRCNDKHDHTMLAGTYKGKQ